MGQFTSNNKKSIKNGVLRFENQNVSFVLLKKLQPNMSQNNQNIHISSSDIFLSQGTIHLQEQQGYEKIHFTNCNVNIFALKYLIKESRSSLKHIVIDKCLFFLTDSDANQNINQVSNRRMLLELNLVHMIESYQLSQIQQIDTELIYKKVQKIQIKDNTNVLQNNQQKQIESEYELLKEQENLIRIFNCEKDSYFLQYETNLKKQFEENYGSQMKMKQFSEELIWGELKNEQYLLKKLDDDTIKQIQESLSIFKKYSKFALKNKMLIIQGSELYSSVSIEQLLNLILLNENSIEAVIFKDNRKIPNRVFKFIQKKISKLSNLKELAFINSIVDEQNIIHLKYLIKKLKIQYLILYKSYFLQSELDYLLNKQNDETTFQVNQFRYSLIDIKNKKNYEFSQYNFCIEDVRSKSQDKVILQEELFLKQQSFPQNIKNIILNYQSKNLAIVQKESIDKIIFNYFKYLHNTKAESRELKQLQDDLIKILEEQFFQDDINEINYSLIEKLILFVQEKEIQQKFKESMESCKSYKILKQKYCLDALKKQTFNNITQLQIRYSYLHGFTNLKDNIDYLITLEVSDLYNIVFNGNTLYFDQHYYNSDRKHQLKFQYHKYDLKCLNFYSKLFMFLNSNYFKLSQADKIIDLIAYNLQLEHLSVNLGVMEKLKNDYGKYIFFGLLKRIKSIKSFEWYDKFTEEQSTIEIDSADLEEFSINLTENRDINRFYQALHNAFNLSKMVIYNLNFTKDGFEQLDRSIFPPYLSNLVIQTKNVESAQYINQLFQCIPNLSSVTLKFNEIEPGIMKEICFSYFLKEIHLILNQEQNIKYIFVKIGLQTFFQLESLSLSGFSMPGKLPQSYSKYLQMGSLPGFENLKKIYLNCKIEDENYVNIVLNNIKVANQNQQNTNYLSQPQQEQQNVQIDKEINQNGLKFFSLIESNMSGAMIANLNLIQQKHSLRLLNFSRNRKVEDFSFLNQIFESCRNLKTLNLSYCNINEENFKKVNMDLTPDSLEKIILNGNFQLHNIDKIIKAISDKCDLKVLHLRDCNLNNKIINNMQFQKIAKSIQSLDLCANSDLTDFTFLEDFYKQDNKLESIYLPRNIDIQKINFEYLRKNLKVLDIDKSAPMKLKSDHFKSYLHQNLGYSFDYLSYQNKYCIKKSDQIIDFHDYFQYANITNQIKAKINEIFDLRDYEANFSFDKIKSTNSNIINYSSDVDFSKHIHPLYFYPFFREHILNVQSTQINYQNIEQNERSQYILQINKNQQNSKTLIDETKKNGTYLSINNQIQEFNNNQRLISIQESQFTNVNERGQPTQNFVKEQNVYQDQEFIVQNFFNELSFSEDQSSILDEQFSKQKNQIKIKNQLRNVDFLPHLMEKHQNIQKIDFSGSNLFFDRFQQNQIKQPLIFLTDLIFSGFRCQNNESCLLIIDQLLKNAPNLLKLNISNTNMSTERSCDFSLISQNLEFLDISYNKFPSLDQLCPDLKTFQIAYQRNFDDLDLDNLIKKIPQNVGEVILTNLENQMNVLIIEKLDKFKQDVMVDYFIDAEQEERENENNLIQFTLETDQDLSSERILKGNKDLYVIKKKMFYIFNKYKSEKRWLLNSVQGKIIELDISGNYDLNMIIIECINQLRGNPNLKVFKASNTNLTDQLISKLSINYLFQNLVVLDISYNYNLKSLCFLNEECDLKYQKLQDVKFSFISPKIKILDFSKNHQLNQIDFLYPIFNKNPRFVLNKLNLLQTNCDLFDFISKYHRQVTILQYELNKFYYNCSNIRTYKLRANMEQYFFSFLSKSQIKEQDKDIFKSLCVRMRDVKEEKQFNSYQQLLIFFLQKEIQMIYPQFQNNFFIMSPNYISQQILKIQKKDFNQRPYKNSNFIDNFNLFLIEHCVLHDKTEYIFAYDKFFFQEYPDFYYQDQDQNKNSIQFLFKLQKQMLESKIKQAFLPIRLVCSQDTLQKFNFSELDLLECLTMIPASEIKLTNLSIQFIKSWYAINYYSPLTISTNIEINFSQFENSSVANFVSNYFYQIFIIGYDNKKLKLKFKAKLSKMCYNIFQIFNSEPQKYKFDHSIIQLEELFDKKQKSFKPIMLLIYVIYIAVCVIGIFLVSQRNNISCGQGISWYSYITYGFFGILTLIYEAYIFSIQLKYVSHLIPELKTNCKRNFPHRTINQVKQFIIDISWLNQWYMNYTISFVFSQLSRFNFFSNIAYLYNAYTCQKYLQFFISIFSISVIALVEIPFLMPKLFNVRRKTKLITQNIDELYEICNAVKFQAVADVFATISPNNSFVFKKKMFNLRIVNNFLRIIFHDIPFIVIQAYEIIYSNSSQRQILINLLTSSLMLAISLNKFLSITPSVVSQEDFNQLNQYKKKYTLPHYKAKLSEYECKFLQYNHVELLKCIQSQSYYCEYLKKQGFQENSREFLDQINFAQSLKKFQYNIDEIKKIFGTNNNLSRFQYKSQHQTQLSSSNYLFKDNWMIDNQLENQSNFDSVSQNGQMNNHSIHSNITSLQPMMIHQSTSNQPMTQFQNQSDLRQFANPDCDQVSESNISTHQPLHSINPSNLNTQQNTRSISTNMNALDFQDFNKILLMNPRDQVYYFENVYVPHNIEIFNAKQLMTDPFLKLKKYKQSIFFGQYMNSKRHGKGLMIYNNGRLYEGLWENDLKHGKGFEKFPNCSVYEGQYVNGKPEGIGTYTYFNGEVYDGQWVNGMKHGSGIWRGTKNDSYIGEWKFGKPDGYGVHTWINGDRYEGQFKGCLKHGEGTEKFSNGDIYIGNYVNGKPEGYGEYYWINQSFFKGYFKNGLRDGHGVWKRGPGNSDTYEGEYVNDKKCGYGVFTWASGNVYKGHYFEDLRHGYGEMYWTDGSYYKGMWERGIQHGEGEMCMPGDTPKRGMFENNVFIGPLDGNERLNYQGAESPVNNSLYSQRLRGQSYQAQPLNYANNSFQNSPQTEKSIQSQKQRIQRVDLKNNQYQQGYDDENTLPNIKGGVEGKQRPKTTQIGSKKRSITGHTTNQVAGQENNLQGKTFYKNSNVAPLAPQRKRATTASQENSTRKQNILRNQNQITTNVTTPKQNTANISPRNSISNSLLNRTLNGLNKKVGGYEGNKQTPSGLRQQSYVSNSTLRSISVKRSIIGAPSRENGEDYKKTVKYNHNAAQANRPYTAKSLDSKQYCSRYIKAIQQSNNSSKMY
ncbi:hypothetical protein ABPG74_002107 [Tetrahymena malaccensis]